MIAEIKRAPADQLDRLERHFGLLGFRFESRRDLEAEVQVSKSWVRIYADCPLRVVPSGDRGHGYDLVPDLRVNHDAGDEDR